MMSVEARLLYIQNCNDHPMNSKYVYPPYKCSIGQPRDGQHQICYIVADWSMLSCLYSSY